MRIKRMGLTCISGAVLVLLVSSLNILSAPGQLDTSFNGTGMATTPFWEARGVAVQSDGKIVVVGPHANASLRDFAVVRFNSDGTPDLTFDTDGRVTTTIGGDDRAYAVAIQSDGKIVVGGWTENGVSYDFGVIRYNSDGSLDTAFDGDGKVVVSISAGNDFAFGLTLQTDGKIVVAGTANGNFAIVRLNPDGSADTSFDADGQRTLSFGGLAEAQSVAIQTDGKIVAGGFAIVGSTYDFALARVNPDGSSDVSFDADGLVSTPVSHTDRGFAVALQTDGRILLAGQSSGAAAPSDFSIVRYLTDGSLDATFGTGGKVTTAVSANNDSATAVAVEATGKIIVGGWAAMPATGNDFAVVRYNSDGSLDSSFGAARRSLWGTGGVAVIEIAGNDTAYGMKLDASGRPLVVGSVGGVFGAMRLQNAVPTAATAALGGRVVSSNGRGVVNFQVLLTSSNGEFRTSRTNSFGYFLFEDLPTGEFYIISGSSRRIGSVTKTLTHQLFDDVYDLELVVDSR